MLIPVAGLCALRDLRKAWQEDAGDDFPEAVLIELLVLHDVCKAMEMNIFQVQDVLGISAWNGIQHHLSTPIYPVDAECIAELVLESVT